MIIQKAQTSLIGFSKYFPFYKGRGRLVYSAGIQKHLRSLPPTICALLYDRQKIYFNPRDYIGSMVYLFRDLDPAISWCLKKLLRPGDIYVDIGANIGTEVIPAAKLVGAAGQVHAFEPNPDILALLDSSLQANKLGNVQLNQCAVSDFNGEINLSIPHENSGSATSCKTKDANCVTVPALRLDAYPPLITQKIRLLKIDVEGHEYSVLTGAEALLVNNQIDHILIEIWPDSQVPFEDRDTVKLLMSYGYIPFQLQKRLSMIPHLRRVRRSRVTRPSADFLFSKQHA